MAAVMCVAKVGAQEIGPKQMKALAKADAAIEHPKKSHKGETWLEHGEAYMEAYTKAHNIEHAKSAKSSFEKAANMDSSLEKSVVEHLATLINELMKESDRLNREGKYYEAAECSEMAYRTLSTTSAHQLKSQAPSILAEAGTLYLAAVNDENKDELLSKAEAMMTEAIEAGYKDNGGIYIKLFDCYYNHRFTDRERYLELAKQTLLKGVELYPTHHLIIARLMELYHVEKGMGKLTELCAIVNRSVELSPNDAELWRNRGLLYGQIENYDEAIASYAKYTELAPDSFEANYGTACFIITKANKLIEELNKRILNPYIDYKREVAKLNDIYAEALPYMERAHELDPSDKAAADDLNALRERLK